MNNSKDIKKTNTNDNLTGRDNAMPSGVKLLSNISIFEYANKKTEKLVTALYLVADSMHTKDTLYQKLRLLGIELMSDIYKLSASINRKDNTYIEETTNRINEIISFIKIAENITYISAMNASILKSEFYKLIEEINLHQSKDKFFKFDLENSMLTVKEGDLSNSHKLASVANLRDKLKKTNSMSLIKNVVKKSLTASDYKNIKNSRIEKILKVIKTKSKKGLPDDGATIKDIMSVVLGYSSKTIQRELAGLISNGQIKKIGSKRWSRYQINKN